MTNEELKQARELADSLDKGGINYKNLAEVVSLVPQLLGEVERLKGKLKLIHHLATIQNSFIRQGLCPPICKSCDKWMENIRTCWREFCEVEDGADGIP